MMGPGMMGMMGPGMMGYYGMGPGMGAHPLYWLDLTDEQRGQINDIQEQARKQQWELGQKMFDEQAKLRDLYRNEKPDPKQVGQIYGDLAKLQQQMAEIQTETQNNMVDVLTKEQREQLQQWRNQMWSAGPGGGYGPGWRFRGR